MSNRTEVFNAIIGALSTVCTARRGLLFIHEINSFPCICYWLGTERRFHYGEDNQLGILELNLRGYTFSDNLESIEILGRSIEIALATIDNQYIQDVRLLTLRTDEGLLQPYSCIDIVTGKQIGRAHV